MPLVSPVKPFARRRVRALAAGLVALTLAFAPHPVAPQPPAPLDPTSVAALPAAAAEDPPSTVSLTLPQTALELRLDYHQLGPDLSRFQEPEGVDAVGLHQLQVMSLLAQGGKLRTGVTLRIGGHLFKPASYPLGFTVSLGGALRFFLVDGTEAVPLPSTDLTPGWGTERLVMQLEYATRTSLRLVWQLGTKAGRIDVGLGSSAPDAAGNAPAPQTPPADGKQPAPGGTPAEPPKNGAPRG